MLERLISKKPFVVFSFSPVFSSQAPLPPSVDLFGAGGQLSGDGACAKDVIQGFRGLRTKFCFDQQLKLEKRILEVASTWWYWVSKVRLWLALGGTGSVRSVLTACVIYAF